MNRRQFLKFASLSYASIASLDSILVAKTMANPEPLLLSEEQKTILVSVVDTILPQDDHPGAVELTVPDFVITMVRDCLDHEAKADYLAGLGDFGSLVQVMNPHAFVELPQDQREKVLKAILAMKQLPEGQKGNLKALKAFVNLTKSLTVQGYMQSKYIMTEVFPYVQIPGPFQASVPISQAKF